MQDNVVANRYAEALLNIEAGKQANVTVLEADLKLVSKIISGDPGIKEFFISPKITANSKKEVMTKVFKDHLSNEFLKFMLLLIDKKRASELESIYTQFLGLADRELNRIRVGLSIPRDFAPNIRSQIAEKKLKS